MILLLLGQWSIIVFEHSAIFVMALSKKQRVCIILSCNINMTTTETYQMFVQAFRDKTLGRQIINIVSETADMSCENCQRILYDDNFSQVP